eukprot:CAMPEP_0182471456 /NCGR_PEP_ID=MMETSP1319-20130603/20373_1 /TAXON_ID=172717 /ORGANISM="Bolidomonas pacifica, Strain RCC208" /LENGTH=56 /DNA_ID=CAMNT_0024672009 /DNA_START=250 /DNA_END=420 /DNA_ORIENTATION=-
MALSSEDVSKTSRDVIIVEEVALKRGWEAKKAKRRGSEWRECRDIFVFRFGAGWWA